jgi:hypothetical protein
MNGNPTFPEPPVSMEALEKIETHKTCMSAARDGSRKAIAERDTEGQELKLTLRSLSGYVEYCCPYDPDTFRTSGFEPAATRRQRAAPLSEGIRKIDYGDLTGTLKLRAVAVPGAHSYEVRWAPRREDGSQGEWNSKSFGHTKRFIIITGLTAGTFYLFQVRALIGTEFTDWSDSVTKRSQ